jgi:hypothetical protein
MGVPVRVFQLPRPKKLAFKLWPFSDPAPCVRSILPSETPTGPKLVIVTDAEAPPLSDPLAV